MSTKYPGGIIKATVTPPTTSSAPGIWTLEQAGYWIKQGQWPFPAKPGLYSWGFNAQGQLGLGNITAYSSPKQVGALTTWSKVIGGSDFTLAIKTDGTLWSWGGNTFGQLGLGNTTNYSSPKQVGALTTWGDVAGALRNTVAVKTDGTLWTWGYNGNGELGLGTAGPGTYKSSPTQVGALTTWSKVATGQGFCLATKTDGTLWSWGYNFYGQLGLGNTTSYSSPKQVGGGSWSKISASNGQSHCIAIKTDGTIWGWGFNTSGQLGLGSITNISNPTQIGALTTWTKTSCNKNSSLATRTDGTLWTWGNNYAGVLGLGTSGAGTYKSSPTQVGSLTTWSNIAGGAYHTVATKTDGTLWSWGWNIFGQLGLGDITDRSSPVQVGALTTWLNITAGSYYTVAILS